VLGDPLVKASTLEYRFTMHNNGKVMNAVYTGVVPDTFKADAEVVVKGQLGPDGVIHIERNGITAKCPSKYEAEKTGPSVR
jgi:cytochrome c-type biogenesis protein CcmE